MVQELTALQPSLCDLSLEEAKSAQETKIKSASESPMCQQSYQHTTLSQTLQSFSLQPLLSKQSQNLQSITPAMMPPASQLLPTQMFKPSPSEIDILSQEKAPYINTDQDPVLTDLCRPLHCKLCNVSLNSTQQAQAHYQGKNHSKKLRNYYAGHQCVSTFKMTHSVDQAATHPPASQSGSSKSASRVILATANDYCKLCDASFSSPAVAQAHYQGKNHAKRLRLAEAQKTNSLLDATELTKRKQRKEGNAFKVVPNRRNLHGVQNTLGPYFNPRSRQRIPRDLAMCVTPSGQFYCSMCNIGASEEQEFRLHLESKLHKCKVSEQRYRSELENLGYV
ncbi:zinc finger matrin-type protein 3 isoform X2 [Narcine bancroftii]|uniref:zinc finger matrin-type protein 3 isoform X2 n=1 Tax=Narcine bancroftii TaxID=1343680 RepID=UPI003831C99F